MGPYLVALALALLAITLIGHASWVFFAWIFRMLLHERPSSSSERPPAPSPSPRGMLERRAELEDALDRLSRSGLLAASTVEEVRRAMARDALTPTTASLIGDDIVDLFESDVVEVPLETPPKLADGGRTAPPRVESGPAVEADEVHGTSAPFLVPSAEAERPIQELAPQDVARRRAQQYMQRRADAAEPLRDAAAPWLPEKVAPPRRRHLSEWLAAFMEEKNIRWGELVGGLLIISCSAALVVSFWSTIAERTFLKYFVFNGVNAFLFAVGFYAANRWKLPTTSTGLLLIAGMLTPLNFLALSSFSKDGTGPTNLVLVGELISVVGFLALTYYSARTLWRTSPIPYALGVMVPAAMELLIRRWIDPQASLAVLYAVGLVPVLALIVANAWTLWEVRRNEPFGEREYHQLLQVLGVTLFAALLACGAMIVRTNRAGDVVHQTAPLLSLIAVPLLATGVGIWKRSQSEVAAARSMVGMGVALIGGMTMLAALALSWPIPAVMIMTGLASGVVLVALATWLPLAIAHAPAVWSLAAAMIIAIVVYRQQLPWWNLDPLAAYRQLVTASTGMWLLAPAGLAVIGAAAWGWLARRGEAAAYAIGAAGLGALSLILITALGFARPGDPENVFWGYAMLAAIAATHVLTDRRVAWCASGLILMASIQGAVYRFASPEQWVASWSVALLAHASVLGVAAAATRQWSAGRPTMLAPTLAINAVLSGALALAWMTVAAISGQASLSPGLLAWAAGAFLLIAWSADSASMFAVFQALAAGACLTWVDRGLQSEPWYQPAPERFLHPSWLYSQAMTLGAIGLFWIIARLAVARWTLQVEGQEGLGADGARLRALMFPSWMTFDRLAVGASVVIVTLASLYAVAPGVAAELTPRGFDLGWPGTPHALATSWRAWAAVGVLIVVLTVGLVERTTLWRVVGLAVVAWSAVLTASAGWDSENAAASALRWGLSGYYLLAFVALWRMPQWAGRSPWMRSLDRDSRITDGGLFGLLTFLAFAPLICMGVYVGYAAIWMRPLSWESAFWLQVMLGIFLTCGALALFLSLVSRPATAGEAAWRSRLRSTAPWKPLSWTLLALSLMPLAALVLFEVGQSLIRHPIPGPDPSSLFARMGLAASYATPLSLIAATLVGFALYLRSEGVALFAGLVMNLCATAAYLLTYRGGGAFAAEQWFKLAQVNTLVAAVFGISWSTYYMSTYYRRSEPRRSMGLLAAQHGIASGFLAAALVGCLLMLLWRPATPVRLQEMADLLGWVAWAVAAASLLACLRALGGSSFLRPMIGYVAAALVLLALRTHAIDGGARFYAYHANMIGGLVFAGFVLGVDLLLPRGWAAWSKPTEGREREPAGLAESGLEEAIAAPPWRVGLLTYGALNWSRGAVLFAVIFAFGCIDRDPDWPWWAIASWAGSAALLTVIASLALWGFYLFAAAILLNIAASAWWFESLATPGAFLDFVYFNLAVAVVPVALWMWVDRRIARLAAGAFWRRSSVHRWATGGTIALLSLLCLISLVNNAWGRSQAVAPMFQWTALVATMVAAVICLWDERARWAAAGLYFLGLVMSATVVDSFDVSARMLLWTLTLVLAAYAVAASYAWSRRTEVFEFVNRMGIPLRREHLDHFWLPAANLMLSASVIAMAFWGLLTCDIGPLRFALAQAVVAQAVAVGMLARGRIETQLRYLALCIGVLGAVAVSWSWLSVDDWQALHRLILAAAAVVATAALYGMGFIKILRSENPWTLAAQRLTPALGILSIALLLAVVGLETLNFFTPFALRPAPWAITLVSATLVGACAFCLVAALVPGRDPFNLSERGRMAYVYAAEAGMALMFLHLRVTVPEWFGGVFARYWPIIVMLVAFLGMGLGEWFRRRRTNVLSEPLERTGVLLPILPVLGYWAAPPPIEAPVQGYSALLVTAGMLYAGMSLLRRSFAYGAVSVAALNLAFWVLLYGSDQLGFLRHPQLWLIPPAVCMLAAASLHRHRLSARQMTSIRYLSGTIIYVSSTADVFVNGVAQAPWLPLVLAGLSILGVFAGIMLRVRAFLYLGTSFLGLALLTMIWHAAVDLQQTWVWYVCGIVVGIAIIAIFALFEKKRAEIQAVVERLKQWDE